MDGTVATYSIAELDEAARMVVAFLRGEAPFDSLRLADTVALYVSPEGGGGRAVFQREQLRDRAAWEVSSNGYPYSFIPPPDGPKVTTRVGRHFNCLEYHLATRYPELAEFPHVGVKLEPERLQSCLQAWSVTIVFDRNGGPPRMVAAVHDRWEW